MRRSALVVLPAVLVGMFVTALPAASATTANVAKPSPDTAITNDGAVPVEVRVERATTDPSVSSVEIRLFGDGRAYSRTPLTCRQGCGTTSQTWGGQVDPQPAPIRNGAWYVQPRVNNEAFGSRSGVRVYLSLPPSPVTNLAASSQDRKVQLTWDRAPEPDINEYRVRRRQTGGQWQQVARLGPDASSYNDVVGAGEYTYQVISTRPSGTPSGGERTATSSPASAKVSAARHPQPYADPPSNPDSGGAPAAGEDAATRPGRGGSGPGSGSGDAPRAGGAAPGPAAPGGSSESTDTRPAAGPGVRRPPPARIAPPPPAPRGFSFGVRSLARAFGFQPPPDQDPDVAEETEEYYGEDEGYSDELDYSGIDPVTGERITVPSRDTGIPGTLQQWLISRLSLWPLLASIAAGLLFMVLAVVVLRWMRSPAPPAADRATAAAGDPTARAPSPTAAPLSPRAKRPPRQVSAHDSSDPTTTRRLAATSPPERRPTRPSPTPLLFDEYDAEAWQAGSPSSTSTGRRTSTQRGGAGDGSWTETRRSGR